MIEHGWKTGANKNKKKLILWNNAYGRDAKQIFEKLFGNTNAPLAKSDPEFFTNYVNFAFDEVPAESKLELKENLMIVLASLVAIPALSEFKTILKAALKNGVEPVAIKEIITKPRLMWVWEKP